jgi:hypothetical protein
MSVKINLIIIIVVMLNVAMLNVVMLTVVMPNVVKMNVVTPAKGVRQVMSSALYHPVANVIKKI